jgi:solute carrier family 35 protein E1|tara:strand:+ start:2426 stop:3346 length:921 start_codon:yes stop_codon:yes gene_type:complete
MLFTQKNTLYLYFALWYIGNYYYNIQNKKALNILKYENVPCAMTISTIQLGVGVIWSGFLWYNPLFYFIKRTPPSKNYKEMIPVSICFAASHSFSVFTMSSGSISFGQIIKSSEPFFAAMIGYYFYNKSITKYKSLCLFVIILGVIIASVNELSFSWIALINGSVANLFAAVKNQENKKLIMNNKFVQDINGVTNMFAMTNIYAFIISFAVMIVKDYSHFSNFYSIWLSNRQLREYTINSGLMFYIYNELSTLTLKQISSVSQSIANTFKRVLVIIGTAIVMNEDISYIKLMGASLAILGVLLYSL